MSLSKVHLGFDVEKINSNFDTFIKGFPVVWTFGIYLPIMWTNPPLQDFAA